MRVRFWELDEEMEEREVGALVLQDGQVVARPKDPQDVGAVRSLQRCLKDPIQVMIDDQGRTLTATDDPQLFLDQLPRAYHGSHFWAGKVEK